MTPRDTDLAPVAASVGSVDDRTPWHADLVELEKQLRRELEPDLEENQGSLRMPFGQQPAVIDHDAFLKKVQRLITESERRQQQERALWLTEVSQELDMQRRADQQQLQRELGALEGFADYLVRVSQP